MQNNFQLQEGEIIEREAVISRAALIMIWVSVPAFLIIDFLTVYLPQIISYAVNAELKQMLLEQLGLQQLSFSNLYAAARTDIYSQIFSFLPASFINFVKGLFTAMLIILIIVWLIWACIVTKLNLRYSLVITNMRVLARAKDDVFETSYDEINNVVVGRSIWGKLLRYGEITVQAENGSVTVKNIADAEEIKNLLNAKIDQDQDKNTE